MALEGAVVAVTGRLVLHPRWRIAAELQRRNARLTQRLVGADHLLIGYGAHARLEPLKATMAAARGRGVILLSERRMASSLGLIPAPPASEPKSITGAELARASALDAETIELLVSFDALEGEGDLFGFQDLLTARQVRRLLDGGAFLGEILAALIAARRSGGILSRERLAIAEDGELVRAVGNYVAGMDGQLRLPLGDGGNPSLDLLFEQASAAEEDRLWSEAESIYRRVIALSPRDAVAHFNLGNVLAAQGHLGAAEAALTRAATLQPEFAEAWYNLAHLREKQDDRPGARLVLERAIAADRNFADALYNLARLWLAEGEPERAAPLFERYLALDATSSWAENARRALQACLLLRRGLLHEKAED